MIINDNTTSYNLKEGNYSCPLGYEQCGNRCNLVDIPYPTFYAGHDIFKEAVMKKVLENEK